MSDRTFLDVSEVLQASPPTQGLDEILVEDCVAAACAAVENEIRRPILPLESTDILDGDRAHGKSGEIIYVPNWPIVSVSGVSITENGEALTVAAGYTTTADVIAVLRRGKFVRRGTADLATLRTARDIPVSGWAPGTQNIAITSTAGWEEADIPDDLKRVTIEAVWLFFRGMRSAGKGSQSRQGQSTTWTKDLSPISARVLSSYKRRFTA